MRSIVVLCVAVAILTGCTNPNTEIPADFPADVPIIGGDIYRAEHADFEDGPGFVVDVLTTLSCEEVFAFYDGIVGPRGDGDVRIETTCSDAVTRYVSIAVHLGREGAGGLNMDEYNRVLGEREGLNAGQFHELPRD